MVFVENLKNVASDSHFCVNWQPHILSFKYWGVATQKNYPDNEFLNVSMNLKRQLTWSFLNTPWKLINMEPKKHPFEKEVISQTSIVGFHVGFRGCKRCKALNLDLEMARKQIHTIPPTSRVAIRSPATWQTQGRFFVVSERRAPFFIETTKPLSLYGILMIRLI